jgi:hypothetical protein
MQDLTVCRYFSGLWTLKPGLKGGFRLEPRSPKLEFVRLANPWRFFKNLNRHFVKNKDLAPFPILELCLTKGQSQG